MNNEAFFNSYFKGVDKISNGKYSKVNLNDLIEQVKKI